ncbi:unnamed protein product [Cylindrotheca closterium]|uniref:Fe2OG dioxygenase domain-containing protein n=1 Tax=Cylindrotheca closterium TaxID=2856 RepID=A0AAD2G8M3_9STRA|nr:unnamed protein product [Cylindrotheca closterium]
MKKQKQLRLLAFMPKKQAKDDTGSKENSLNEEWRQPASRKRSRSAQSQSDYNKSTGVASIFERPKLKPKQTDLLAENLGKLLGRNPQYLASGSDGDPVSWILHVPNWFPSKAGATGRLGISCGANITDPSCAKPVQDFQAEWNLHPTKRKQLKIFGRPVSENRWSQAWGKPMDYSGMIDDSDRPLDQSPNLPFLIQQVNTIMKSATSDNGEEHDQNDKETQVNSGRVYHEYNACLQNWYQPDHSIGLHSDDESNLYANYPIFSISWGGTRRFLLRPKEVKTSAKNGTNKQKRVTPAAEPVEIWLKDGDLLIMGGACQKTHKHEVPRPRKKDPVTVDRICWTIRAIKS